MNESKKWSTKKQNQKMEGTNAQEQKIKSTERGKECNEGKWKELWSGGTAVTILTHHQFTLS